MKLTLLRHATLVLDLGGVRVLVDPMLSPAGRLPPLAVLRHRLRLNPLVDLPSNADGLLAGIQACILSHFRRGHFDHLDGAGRAFLRDRQIPVYCPRHDVGALASAGIEAVAVDEEPTAFFGGSIQTVPARHGHGIVGRMMGCGAGFLVRVPGEPTLYLSGDTVLTSLVRETLERERPQVAVVHAGGAQLDVGRPILMSIDEVRSFAALAPGHVVAVHLEALNHCPTTRAEVRALTTDPNIGDRLRVPEDGETLDLG